jgi:hypothetical protein
MGPQELWELMCVNRWSISTQILQRRPHDGPPQPVDKMIGMATRLENYLFQQYQNDIEAYQNTQTLKQRLQALASKQIQRPGAPRVSNSGHGEPLRPAIEKLSTCTNSPDLLNRKWRPPWWVLLLRASRAPVRLRGRPILTLVGPVCALRSPRLSMWATQGLYRRLPHTQGPIRSISPYLRRKWRLPWRVLLLRGRPLWWGRPR